MKSPLIILGNSPFISQVDIPKLCELYTVVGFNGAARDFRIHHVFFFDKYYEGSHDKVKIHYQSNIPENVGSKYFARPSDKPLFGLHQEGCPVYGFKHYTPSIALNWALINKRYKIYLVGIDHHESDTEFDHYDGARCYSILTPESHKNFKNYVYNCRIPGVSIFQTNPAVKDSWNLPYKDLEELYDKKQS